MNYTIKAARIRKALQELKEVPYSFPLLSEMIKRRQREQIKYFAAINYNLMVYGKTALKFDDIDY